VIDGYTQPGSAPNTNSILDGNSARIAIILDSSSTEFAPNPLDPTLPHRRSTRLDFPGLVNTGYGRSENAILGVYGADNVKIRGLSFLGHHAPETDFDPSIYAVALINQSTNARVQGCWFGLPPGGSSMADVRPVKSAVAGFRWRPGGDLFSAGLIFGTDGDGLDDRSEFNIGVGCQITLALELPGARIAGNFFNVFPDGHTFANVDAVLELILMAQGNPSVESIENGRMADGTIIGTNGDGISDAEERNIFVHSVYERTIEFYGSARGLVIAGNYFGVGGDGVSLAKPSVLINPDLISLPPISSIRIGSDGDGVSDHLEGNAIHGVPGLRFCSAGGGVPIMARGNIMVGNQFHGVPFADADANGRTFGGYYTPYVTTPFLGVPPVITQFTGGVLRGWFAAGVAAYQHTVIDVYELDSTALGNTNNWPKPMLHSRNLLGSFQDNGPEDLDTSDHHFALDLGPWSLSPTTHLAVAVSYSMVPGDFDAGQGVTSPLSSPVAGAPTIHLRRPDFNSVEIWWMGPQATHLLQLNPGLEPDNWFELFEESYYSGRCVVPLPIDLNSQSHFFRLISR
jgi:hypothetical protein